MEFHLLTRHNNWIPRMKCSSCMDAPYERIPEEGPQVTNEMTKEVGGKTKLLFHNDDGSEQTVYIEPHLLTRHLLATLATKNRVPKHMNYAVIEHLDKMGIERIVEDHEYICNILDDNENFPFDTKRIFYSRKDDRKYDVFEYPDEYFPHDILDHECRAEIRTRGITSILLESRCPTIVSWGWMFDAAIAMWKQAYFVLKDKKLYVTLNRSLASRFHSSNVQEQDNNQQSSSCMFTPLSVSPTTSACARLSSSPPSPGHCRLSDLENSLHVFARLSDYQVYTTVNARNHFRAPTEWGLCLRPAGQQDTEPDLLPGLRCVAFNSEHLRDCWLTAMRLAKYGKTLRDSYLQFKNKKTQEAPEFTSTYSIQTDAFQPRVPMDFSGGEGFIVNDKEEARAIEVGEGSSWKRRWRPPMRSNSSSPAEDKDSMINRVHINKPWFHSGLTRDKAAKLVSKYGTVDGVFLVRESRSHAGAFVLTYICQGKVMHTQIQTIRDPVQCTNVFSLDGGKTKFYDLLQLVEFYELNAGGLPTRLTHYIIQKNDYSPPVGY